MNKQILSIILLFITTVSFATEQKSADKNATDQRKPVQDAPKVRQGNVMQPEITITDGKDKTVKEYHINGQLRAIKVMPKNGFPHYFLIDHKGNGEFVKMGPDMGPELEIPQWILFEW